MAAKAPEGCPLTPRELEVMQSLCETGRYHATAAALGLARSTVASHVSNAHRKLGVATATAAMAIMGRNGWVGWVEPAEPDEATPLAVDRPFLAAYVREFERSRWPHEPDARSRLGMRLALAGHRNTMKP